MRVGQGVVSFCEKDSGSHGVLPTHRQILRVVGREKRHLHLHEEKNFVKL